jgi:uncharacterized cupredoxin-like copper-binding protein
MGVVLGVATGPAAGKAQADRASRVTVITVTAGKPSELAFKLSKTSSIPSGTVTFKVTNKGKIVHDFKVCTRPVTSTAANSCTGKVTRRIAPGKSASLTVLLSKKGKYEFLCTVPGHATAGMKGLLGIGVAVSATTPVKATTTTTPAATTTTTPASDQAKPCTSPQSTTVAVSMFEFGYTLTPASFPCGTVTFNVKNNGMTDHDFVIENLVGQGRSAVIGPGESTTVSATLTPATWTYYCSVPTHRGLGMEGRMTVSG